MQRTFKSNLYSKKSSIFRGVNILELSYNPVVHWVLYLACGLSVFMYAYFIISTIRNGVVAEKLQGAISKSKTEITSLEYSYMSLANTIDLREAYSRGFVDSKNPVYVSLDSVPALSLSR